jgi:hypothetical protein
VTVSPVCHHFLAGSGIALALALQMNALENPYQPPLTNDLLAPSRDGLRIDGKAIVAPKGYVFPTVCLKSGAIDDLKPRETRKFKWSNPKLAFFILVNILLYALLASIFSKSGEIHFQVSREAARKRRNALMGNWGLFFLAIACFVLGGIYEARALFLAGGASMLACIIFGVIASRFFWAEKVDKTHIWIRGIPEHVAIALVQSEGHPG